MIIIFSNTQDFSTFDVIKWLNHMGEYEVIRINFSDGYIRQDVRIHIKDDDFVVHVDGREVRLKDIRAVWYRKGRDWLGGQFYQVTIDGHPRFSHYLRNKIKNEGGKLSEYLNYIIENTVPVLGTAFKSDLNKLITLNMAKSVGLMVPGFVVADARQTVEQLFHDSPDIITKSMSDGIYLFEKAESEIGYFSYTEKLTDERINELPEKIAPSFLQEGIDKDFEVRVFFLDGECHAMAIFSQSDKKTQIDFRKYNEERPNRFVPFVLPGEVEKKLVALFRKIDLNTGSVDLIVDKKGGYYFLEINPVGQFGMVSTPCNYQLEKKVALKLLEICKTNCQN